MKKNIRNILILIVFFNTLSLFSQKKEFYQINDELFELRGNWEVLGKIKSSGQYVLNNKKEKLMLSISVRKSEYFEFYEKDLTEKQLLDKFYKWEYDYWADSTDLNHEVSEIKVNQEKNYIVWKLIIKNFFYENENDKSLTSYILYHVRNKNLISINLSSRKEEFSENDAVEYLEKIYDKSRLKPRFYEK